MFANPPVETGLYLELTPLVSATLGVDPVAYRQRRVDELGPCSRATYPRCWQAFTLPIEPSSSPPESSRWPGRAHRGFGSAMGDRRIAVQVRVARSILHGAP
jgi:hypothetical protein